MSNGDEMGVGTWELRVKEAIPICHAHHEF